MFYSPLRYPGGKNKLAKFVSLVCEKNKIDGHYVEPYAGGASVALHLLINDNVKEITINDFDRSIYAFWYCVLHDTDRFCSRIKNVRVTVRNWKKQRKVQDQKKTATLFDLGFSTFFLNRTNRSGIIDGGIIGGLDQTGDYKINCRFNKIELINRIKRVASFKKHIHLYGLDALELINKIEKDKNTIFYFDPPYYLKGPSLYLNHYLHDDHKAVSEKIKKIKNSKWIVSYDNTIEIKKLYSECHKKEFVFFHTAYEIREGKEIFFFSKNLAVPRIKEPTKIR